MILKYPDDSTALISGLEALAAGTGPDAKRAAVELRNRKAGLRAEQQTRYLIDDRLANAKNCVVIHDLRLEHEGRVAQIDHLILTRTLEVYVLETKSFHEGVKINENGEFLRWNGFQKKYEGMPSPLCQNDRHISVLRDVVYSLSLPVRLGVRLKPDFLSLVLVSSNAQIIRAAGFDSSRVIKTDQMFDVISKDGDSVSTLRAFTQMAKIVSLETLAYLGRQLVERHRPLTPQLKTAAPDVLAPVSAVPLSSPAHAPVAVAPACKSCSAASGSILSGKFGYYFKCGACTVNTPIRFACQTGHSPRLRKSGPQFFRECDDCKSSVLFFTNTAP